MTLEESLVELDWLLSQGVTEIISDDPVLRITALVHGVPVRSQLEDWRCKGSGDGSGTGIGRGFGTGSGDGLGDGTGDGDVYGTGAGFGTGDGIGWGKGIAGGIGRGGDGSGVEQQFWARVT